MQSFKRVKTVITPLDQVNVDTDQIVPKQFLKLVQKSGFGKFLFYDWRYDDQGIMKNIKILKFSLQEIILGVALAENMQFGHY